MYNFVEFDNNKTIICRNENDAYNTFEWYKQNYFHVRLYINGYLVAESEV